ncbi:MAG: hypothetical protein RL701_4128 [Pseudomonadota bacterium]
MKPLACRHFWQVEAAHDGRLPARDLVAFEAHARDCNVCSHERQRLVALARQLREHEPPADQVSVYRVRQKLMAQLDARVTQPTRWNVRYGLAACAALTLIAIGTAFSLLSPPVKNTSVAPTVQITVLGAHAHWSRAHAAGVEHVKLFGAGVFNIHIKRKPTDPRVVVTVPDGEIEDLGTTFQVSLSDAHTIQIAVIEGVVLLRRPSLPTVRLAAGDVWRPEPEQPLQQKEPAASNVDTPTTPRPGPGQRALANHRLPSGTGGQAGTLDEDASYLRVLSLLREGRDFEAQLAAVEYLKRFPSGFRRAEMGRVAVPH